jgi:hypothetical protein
MQSFIEYIKEKPITFMRKNEDLISTLKGIVGSNQFRDMTTAIRSNGKSKSVEDFNILEEYQTRFDETPSVLKITHDDCDLFLYEKLKALIKKEFSNFKVLYNDTDYNLKRDKYITNREVWYIDEGYLLNLWTSESKNIYANPELDIKMSKHDQLIEGNTLLVPPIHSNRVNKEIETRIIGTFKNTTIKEYDRNSIGMMSVDGSGELYVKEFTLDKKFKIQDLDLHYGSDFKTFHTELLKKLKTDKKGLVLLHGDPGTGKTFYIRYLLQNLAKTKKKVLYFPPSMVESVTDPAFFNFITNWTMDNGKNSVLLIEDAEPLLVSRESSRNMGITNLLNLTDGILNDILSIQIIATFNTGLGELDKALLRPERLIARKEFKKLTIDNAKKLSEVLGLDTSKIDKDMSLAEIYSVKNDSEVLLHGVDKDKSNGERPTIGFKK